MATETKNYGFIKPDINEFYDRNIDNENLDKIDEELKRIEEAAGNLDDLDTEEKTGLVAAINELKSQIGNLTTLETEEKASLVSSVNEIHRMVSEHLAEIAPHEATSEATANRLMLRDANGRVKFNSDNVLQNLGIAFYDAGVSDYTTGQTIVSEKTLSNGGLYLLFTNTGIDAHSATYGLYLVGFQGTQKNIRPILEDSGGISVSINADNKIEITNTSGSNRSLVFSLIRVR